MPPGEQNGLGLHMIDQHECAFAVVEEGEVDRQVLGWRCWLHYPEERRAGIDPREDLRLLLGLDRVSGDDTSGQVTDDLARLSNQGETLPRGPKLHRGELLPTTTFSTQDLPSERRAVAKVPLCGAQRGTPGRWPSRRA